jgi:hypothetical protein
VFGVHGRETSRRCDNAGKTSATEKGPYTSDHGDARCTRAASFRGLPLRNRDNIVATSRLECERGQDACPQPPVSVATAAIAGECFSDHTRGLRCGRMDRRVILALAHRGVTHVRGKDCVHPDIGLVIVRMISFPARESGQRARMAVR